MSKEGRKEIKNVLDDALEEYNRFRTPEVRATLKHLSRDRFTVDFRGTFCVTCGFYDYFDDLKYELLDRGLVVDVEKINEVEDGAIVEFSIKQFKKENIKKKEDNN